MGPQESAEYWQTHYRGLPNPLTPDSLASALALVHPMFQKDCAGEFFTLTDEGWGNVNLRKCNFVEVSGIECAWNGSSLQTRLDHDHRWPDSLGGPKSGHNLLVLCETHNLAKGNGLRGFDWSEVPAWLKVRLEQISQKIMIGYER